MKIKSIHIKNYKSLKNVKIDNIGNFNVFIGKNNSGKSNILEALALQDIKFDPEQIHFEENAATIEIIYDNDIGYFLPKFKDEITKKLKTGQYRQVVEVKTIKHVLVHERDKLKLEFIIETPVGQIKRVTTKENGGSNGNLTFVEQLVKTPPELVDVYGGYMPASESEANIPPEIKEVYPSRTLKDQVKIINDILSKIKKETNISFLKIDDKRSIPKDLSLLDEIKDFINDPRNRLKKGKLMEYIKRIESDIYEVYTPRKGEIKLTYEEYPKRGINFNDFGSGMLQLVEIIYRILKAEDQIVLIEEPEMNLHPEAQRILLDFLEDQSKNKQILITTHSPIFASQTKLENVRLVAKNNKAETYLSSITEENIYRIIEELGVKPGDIFDDDVLVFVEGSSDVGIFQEFTKKLKLNLKIGFIDSEGYGNMHYYANAKILQSRRVKIPVFVIFDGDTERRKKHKEIKRRLEKELDIPEDHIITLNKNSIEDYILIPRAIKEAFPEMKMSEDEIKRFLEENKEKKNKKNVLDKLFRKGGMGKYKEKEYGKKIAEKMKIEEIDEEIKKLIKKFVESAKNESI